jgi:IMP dehydrogenase
MDGLKYSFKDVFIIPQYSEVTSRSVVDTSYKLGNEYTLDTPVISANMDSITGPEMAIALWKAGAVGALHRFWTPMENVAAYYAVTKTAANCFVSIGVNDRYRAMDLYNAGARYFIVDIAHGHSSQMKETLLWLKKGLHDIYVVAGNVATPEGVTDLQDWGANAIKIGIGPGAACLTKNVTGVTYPQFSAIQECAAVAKVPLIADGGCTEIGDIAKALGAGASMVMLGRMFAACKETPSIVINGQKVYRGMASRDAMKIIRTDNLPTPEGASLFISDTPTTATEVVGEIKGGLQSAFSYSNATNLSDFSSRVKFGIRK